MGIRYLCHDCAMVLSLYSFGVIRDAEQKYCDQCGQTDDNLLVVGEEALAEAVRRDKEEGFATYYLDRELCLSGI